MKDIITSGYQFVLCTLLASYADYAKRKHEPGNEGVVCACVAYQLLQQW